jgi:DNA polymerase-3 subunit gamma/tau
LKIKKELENSINEKNKLIDDSKGLTNDFDNDQLLVSWEDFYKELIKNGRKNLASILLIDNPKIINRNEIHFTLTNETNKIELEKNKNELIKFLKKSLRNSQIKLIINVDKIKEKKFVYTPSEKYEKLKSINPSIEKIRKDFKLNL